MKLFFTRLLALSGMLILNTGSMAQNLLGDGRFNTTSSITPFYVNPPPLNIWCSWLNNGTSVSTEVVGGVAHYQITSAGIQSWEVQLAQWGFVVEEGYRYRLSFDVKADADRGFGVFIGENEGNWTNYNQNYLQNAGTEWKTLSLEFDVWKIYPLNKLSFEMGGQNIDMYFDNIILQKIGVAPPPVIEMIGSSVPPYDWSAGAEMQTADGIHYSLTNYTVTTGEARFRQDKQWIINWGALAFPSGIASQNGPNIPVPAGTYDISFNRNTGEYKFSCLGCPPAIGIIGSAVPPYNWSMDVKMSTQDGVIYTLNNIDLAWGELKFRQDDDWAINWGNSSFPTGTAILNGPNIPVQAGTYNITFNRTTGEYKFELQPFKSIGILGSALSGWVDDVDMETTDGIIYRLTNCSFNAGEVKFRQDNSWAVNWGNTSFPWGTGISGGPNIPVPSGNYNVTFNRLTGEYYFEVVCPDPVLICPPDTTVIAPEGICGSMVFFKTPEPAESCGYPYVFQIGGLPSGSFFQPGYSITNTFMMVNSSGKTATCSFMVTVKDKEAPKITDISVSPAKLWPANHKMVDVKVYYNVSDNCSVMNSSLSVSSNEPQNGTGDGDSSPDWVILDNQHVQLRAERSGAGQGRIYTIMITAYDPFGNSRSETVQVKVLHDLGKMGAAENGGNGMTDQAMAALECKVTPNPTTQNFNLYIRSGSAGKIEIRVYDISGRLMQSLAGSVSQPIRFGDDLRPGIYYLKVSQDKEQRILQLIKQ